MPFDWNCPFCNRAQVVTGENSFIHQFKLETIESDLGNVGLSVAALVCRSPECKKLALRAMLGKWGYDGSRWAVIEAYDDWRLLPRSHSKPQPDYIPGQLRSDYLEACLIRDLSPKASAALSRRCIQGLIRDFCGISERTLNSEISKLRSMVADGTAPRGVTPESVDAIDHVRKIGNIGAHMEADVNTIIDIEADEAQILIELIETLFEDWYVERDTRTKRFANIASISAEKEAIKLAAKSAISNAKTAEKTSDA